MKELLKLLMAPLILLGVYLAVVFIWSLVGLPPDDQLLAILEGYFIKFGLWIVFTGALMEGFLLLGQYVPGGFIIFIGVLSAGNNIRKVVTVLMVVSLGFFIAYALNYWVGKHGWYKLLIKLGFKHSLEESKDKLIKQGVSAVIFSYWEPNLASITATAAGILHVPLRKFLLFSGIAVVFWNSIWGSVLFLLGESAVNFIGLKYIIGIFGIWAAIILIKHYLFDKRRQPTQT